MSAHAEGTGAAALSSAAFGGFGHAIRATMLAKYSRCSTHVFAVFQDVPVWSRDAAQAAWETATAEEFVTIASQSPKLMIRRLETTGLVYEMTSNAPLDTVKDGVARLAGAVFPKVNRQLGCAPPACVRVIVLAITERYDS